MKDYPAKRPNGEPFRGVRYRQHPTRLHGLYPDRYYFLKYWARGKTQSEGVGWASDGVKPSAAHERFIQIKASIKNGTYETPAEKKARQAAERQSKEEPAKRAKVEALTVDQFWNDTYRPDLNMNKRPGSVKSELWLYNKWIKPVIGERAFLGVSNLDVERIKRNMQKKGKSESTIRTALAVIRQFFNMARRHNLYCRENPVKGVKFPKADNRRTRFLHRNEAAQLLNALWQKSPDLHDQALFSMGSGARFSELANITWHDVDLDRGEVLLTGVDRTGKSGKSRTVPLAPVVVQMLLRRRLDKGGAGSDLVFPSRTGGPMGQVSATFMRVVGALGMNAGITDRRQKVVFHSLRHTYCSWLVERGVTLFIVAKLAGHRTISMTERYSHLAPDTLRNAVNVLDETLKATPAPEVVELEKEQQEVVP